MLADDPHVAWTDPVEEDSEDECFEGVKNSKGKIGVVEQR